MARTTVSKHKRTVNGKTVDVVQHSRKVEKVEPKSKSPIKEVSKFPKEFKRYVSFVDKEGKNVKVEIEYKLLRGNSAPYFAITRERAGSSGAGGWIPKNEEQQILLDFQDKYHLKSDIPKDLELRIDSLIRLIEDAEENTQDDLGLSGWMLEAMKELAEDQDEVFTEANEISSTEFEVEGANRYRVFASYDDAKTTAIDELEEQVEDDPENFLNDFFLGYIDTNRAENFFTDIYNEQNYGYAEDIQSEGSSQGYENRLVDELLERNIITEDQAEEEDFDGSDFIDEFVEEMTNDSINEGRGGYDYYESNFGEEEAKTLAKDNGLIDIRSASENAVNIDGVGHFLAGYDGADIELPSGAYAFKN